MRWISYFILAYLFLSVQVGIAGFAGVRGAEPNFVLLAAIFIALNAPRDAALLGCFSLGLLQDLLSGQTLGLYGLAYGLMALIIIGAQQMVDVDHPLTYLATALVGSAVVMGVVLLHGWLRPTVPLTAANLPTNPPLPAARASAATEAMRLALTALLAPIVLGALRKLKRFFAFKPLYNRVNIR